MWESPHLNMKKLSFWYAFMRFQESWYSYMGFLGCSRCLTPVTIVNHIPFHPKLEEMVYFSDNAHLDWVRDSATWVR